MVINDFAYSMIAFDGYKAPVFWKPGAKDG